jgi:phosphoglycerate transport regulatory protein PgtC
MTRLLGMLAWLLAGWVAGPAAAKEKLTVLTSYPEEVVSRYEIAFERAYPDIDLSVLWRMPRDALPYLRQPEQGGVDVYWAASQRNFAELKRQGGWQKLGIARDGLDDRLGALPLIDPDGYFCATEIAGYGFAVNPGYLQKHGLPTPASWQELADARYQDHLALPVPSKVGYAPMMIDSVLQQYGWEPGWTVLAGIAANARLVESGATFISDVIGSGERGIAPTIDFFAVSAAANGAPLTFVYPSPAVFSPAHIAIMAASRHPDAARRFVAFVLSPAGQKLLFHPDIRKLPVRASVYAEKPEGAYDPFAAALRHPVVYDPSLAGPRLALNNALFDRLFTDHLQRMQTLWRKLREHERRAGGDSERLAKIRRLLTAAPISEQQGKDAQSLFAENKGSANADAETQTLQRRWAEEIGRRYAEAEQLLRQLTP